MEGKHIAVCVVAGVLGLIAIIMGFVAEATRFKADQVVYADGTCFYPSSSSPSLALGIIAAIILLIQQIVISVGSGCFCCRGNPCPSTCGGITALICYIFSWLVCLVAVAILIYGAALNSISTLANMNTANGCAIPKFGVFIVAGVLCIISVALSFIAYTILISSEKKSGAPNPKYANEHGIATAKPQMPTNV